MWWGCSSRPGAAATPGESCRVQSSKPRWQKAEEQRKGQNISAKEWSKPTKTVKVAYIHNLPLTPLADHSWQLKATICVADHDAHSNALTCSVITSMEEGTKIRVNLNKGTGLLFVSLGSSRWPWRPPPAISLKRMQEHDEPEPSYTLYSLPIIPSPSRAPPFSTAGRQSWSIHTQVSNTSLWPHTPRVPNPVTPGPNTLSAPPKGSCAPSLTFSAPICQNHNPYTSPLITRQERYHLKN